MPGFTKVVLRETKVAGTPADPPTVGEIIAVMRAAGDSTDGVRLQVGIDAAWTFGKEFISILRNHDLPKMDGRGGAFYCIWWGEVSDDSDGPTSARLPVRPGFGERQRRSR
jgi:hypothetical protein